MSILSDYKRFLTCQHKAEEEIAKAIVHAKRATYFIFLTI
jgi:hypothetical protein